MAQGSYEEPGEQPSTSPGGADRHAGRPLATAIAVILLLVVAGLLGSSTGLFHASQPPAGTSPTIPSLGLNELQRPLEAAQIATPSSTDLVAIALRLLFAAFLGAAISFRGSRRRNEFQIVHTNMLIAVTGAMMMIIVGSDLARAFGLVGASSIARYRTPVGDPKALASVFVSMGAGIAVGVGLYELALVATILVIAVELLLERGGLLLSRGWYRPERPYELSIATETAEETLEAVRRILDAAGISHVLMEYERAKKSDVVNLGLSVGVPDRADTEKLTLQILSAGAQAVSWRLAKE